MRTASTRGKGILTSERGTDPREGAEVMTQMYVAVYHVLLQLNYDFGPQKREDTVEDEYDQAVMWYVESDYDKNPSQKSVRDADQESEYDENQMTLKLASKRMKETTNDFLKIKIRDACRLKIN